MGPTAAPEGEQGRLFRLDPPNAAEAARIFVAMTAPVLDASDDEKFWHRTSRGFLRAAAGLGDRDLRVLLAHLALMGATDVHWHGMAAVAELAGKTRARTNAATTALVGAGWLTRSANPGRPSRIGLGHLCRFWHRGVPVLAQGCAGSGTRGVPVLAHKRDVEERDTDTRARVF